MCGAHQKDAKKDSVAGVKGAQGRVTEQNSDCRRRCRNAMLLLWCPSRIAAEEGKQRSTGADAITSSARMPCSAKRIGLKAFKQAGSLGSLDSLGSRRKYEQERQLLSAWRADARKARASSESGRSDNKKCAWLLRSCSAVLPSFATKLKLYSSP